MLLPISKLSLRLYDSHLTIKVRLGSLARNRRSLVLIRLNRNIAVEARVSETSLFAGAVDGIVLRTVALQNIDLTRRVVEPGVTVGALGGLVSLEAQRLVDLDDVKDCQPGVGEARASRLDRTLPVSKGENLRHEKYRHSRVRS